MAGLYLLAGLYHFINPKLYLRIMPRYLPAHRSLVYISGAAEIAVAVLLIFPAYRILAIFMLMGMLLVFLLVHFYMLSGKKEGAGIPAWLLVLRIPLQFVLIYWAYSYL